MQTKKIIKIGNSQGVILDKTILAIANICINDNIYICCKKGKIIIEKVKK